MVQKLSYDEKQNVVQIYGRGCSMGEIASLYGVTASAIYGILKRRKIAIRHGAKRRIHHFAQNRFDLIDSPDKAYWLGFLMADGSVTDRSLYLEIATKDVDHLCKFKAFMDATCPINHTRKNCSRIILNSTKLVTSLNGHGVVQNKSLVASTPESCVNLLPDFYRGFFDGDGWVTKHKRKKGQSQHEFGFSSGSMRFLFELQMWLSNRLGKKCGYLKRRTRNGQSVCQLIIGGNRNFKHIKDKLWPPGCTKLERKFLQIQEFCDSITCSSVGASGLA